MGSNTEIAFDVRLVTATNRDLEELIEQKRFREDLFYRINVVRISVPPLRERSSDVLELAHYFLARHAERSGKPPLSLSPEAAKKLVTYAWRSARQRPRDSRTAWSARWPSRAITRSRSMICLKK